jgi:23S rRNA pseudouridine1911/1915/1917 synthase
VLTFWSKKVPFSAILPSYFETRLIFAVQTVNIGKMFNKRPAWVIAENKYWIALNKPAGISVEKQRGASDTLEDQLESLLGEDQSRRPFIGIVHRLDRPTSGLVLFAKKASSLRGLNEQFAARSVQKTYLALLEGAPVEDEAILEHWLFKNQAEKKAEIFAEAGPGRELARLAYRVLERREGQTLVEIDLQTGRYHQIRAQFAAIGHPICGDLVYGAKTGFGEHHIALHAWRLRFTDPQSGEEITLSADANW